MQTVARIASAAIILGVALTAGMPIGCTTQQERDRKVARKSASEFRSDLDKMPGQIDRVISDLTSLTSTANTNRTATFNDYTRNLNALREQARSLGEQADAASIDATRYFRDWADSALKEKDPASREAALKGLDQRRQAVADATSYLERGKAETRRLINSLDEIRTKLSGNLSQGQIDSVSGLVESSIRDSVNVKEYVARLDEQIDAVLAIK
jgi:hypothetical protein